MKLFNFKACDPLRDLAISKKGPCVLVVVFPNLNLHLGMKLFLAQILLFPSGIIIGNINLTAETKTSLSLLVYLF